MAVQAQFPTNVLLQNRIVRESKNPLGNDYSLQPQPGGGGAGFVDESHMLFHNGVGSSNPRKRGRELTATTIDGGSVVNRLVSMEPQPHHFIDLTRLHTPQPNVVSTGLRLAFADQQQQQSSQSSQSSVLLSLLSEDLASQIKQQRDEIDNFLQSQGEQLRRCLAQKRQRHYSSLLEAAEESVARRMREKEAEVEKAVRRNAELQARAMQLSAEAQAWQARARAQEAAAATVQAQLQQAMMGGLAGGCADLDGEEGGLQGCAVGDADDAESAYVDPDRVVEAIGPSCRVCRRRIATVVVLPCRHLCVCMECDAEVQACPLCLSFRSSSVEVFLC